LIPFVDLDASHAPIRAELEAAFAAVMEAGDFILGDAVATFEQEWAEYCGVRHVIGTDSGLSALELALRAYDIGPGDEVITAANTFVATVFAIAHTGATPVLVDVDPATANIDPEAVAAAVTSRTRAVIPVHLYGQPAEMNSVLAVAEAHGLVVIEDACQAHGARYDGRRAGSIGHAAAFSFYPAKNLGAFGDGGAVVTDDDECAERLQMLRNYGQRRKYEHAIVGYNRRLDTLHAALLRVKLGHLDTWNDLRRATAARYEHRLRDTRVGLFETIEHVEHVWHLYVVRTPRRDALREHLGANGVATGIHYPIPVHLQDACLALGYPAGSFPVTERLAAEILSLPMYPGLPLDDVDRVAEEVASFVSRDDVASNGARVAERAVA
jgi:dTDP-4-amino-4,6-dideoxygalactose transaminase